MGERPSVIISVRRTSSGISSEGGSPCTGFAEVKLNPLMTEMLVISLIRIMHFGDRRSIEFN